MQTRAKKWFGQHFLVNPGIARKIAEAASLSPDDVVLEIGPGLGILTEQLLARAGQVTAVEIDRSLIDELTGKFGTIPKFRLVTGDILETDLDDLFRGTPRRIVVAANIPYNITTPIIELLGAHRRLIDRAVLMVQKEVADRLLAPPGSRTYGLTTINLSLSATGRKIMTVSPGSFSPPPEVTSAVIALTFSPGIRYPLRDESLFRALTGAAFRQRRKMIRNSVFPFLESLGIGKDQALELFKIVGISPEARPETIDTARFAALANTVAAFQAEPVTERRI